MSRRDFVLYVALSFVSYAIAVVLAAAFMSLVACGGKGQRCPEPKHPAIDNGGQSPGQGCEVRK